MKGVSKIAITVNNKPNANNGVYAVQGNGGSSDQRTLRVAGVIALRKGWKVSVRVYTKDKTWVATTQSGFSCHMLTTFDECTRSKEQAQALEEVFDFIDGPGETNSPSPSPNDTETYATSQLKSWSTLHPTLGTPLVISLLTLLS